MALSKQLDDGEVCDGKGHCVVAIAVLPRRNRIPVAPAFRLTAVLVAAFAWLPVAAVETPPLCRGADENSSPALSTPIPEGFAAKVDSLWALVEALQDELGVALSFIEAGDAEPIDPPRDARTLEGVLRAIVEQHPSYRCEVISGRLVLRSKDLLFDETVSNVDIVDQYRFPARDAYIDHLRKDPRFADWTSLWARAGSTGGIVDERVTLSPRAPLVLHLVQLLGQDRAVYFIVPVPGPGTRARFIFLREVPSEWQRRYRRRADDPPTPPAKTPLIEE